ncbi:hypothetical protein ABMI35_005058, partial [Escherichia coli]
MNKLACLSGRFGRPGIVFIGVAALWWLITRYGAFLGAETRRDQILLLILLSLGLLFVCYLPVMKKYVQELTYRRRARKEQRLPDDEERLAQTSPRYVTVQDIRHTLRRQHGRFWGRKIRILLITGTASEVELLTPGLTEQFWQEEQGTLLLWGGDPSQPENADWLAALRRLRYRPADGIVWVTSGLSETLSAPLTEDALDRVSRAVSSCCERLGWRLPLYVWSLQESPDERGRITQPV